MVQLIESFSPVIGIDLWMHVSNKTARQFYRTFNCGGRDRAVKVLGPRQLIAVHEALILARLTK